MALLLLLGAGAVKAKGAKAYGLTPSKVGARVRVWVRVRVRVGPPIMA